MVQKNQAAIIYDLHWLATVHCLTYEWPAPPLLQLVPAATLHRPLALFGMGRDGGSYEALPCWKHHHELPREVECGLV